MADIDKTIKELRCCIQSEEECFCPDDCPYNDGDASECQATVMRDALELLEVMKAEQERRANNGAFD